MRLKSPYRYVTLFLLAGVISGTAVAQNRVSPLSQEKAEVDPIVSNQYHTDGVVHYRGHKPSPQQQQLIQQGLAAIETLEKTTSADPGFRESTERQYAAERAAAERLLIAIIDRAEKEYQDELNRRREAEKEYKDYVNRQLERGIFNNYQEYQLRQRLRVDYSLNLCNESIGQCYTPTVATTIFHVIQTMDIKWGGMLNAGIRPSIIVVNSVVNRRVSAFVFNEISKAALNQNLKNDLLGTAKSWYDEVSDWSDGPAIQNMYNKIGSDVGDAFRQTQGELAKQGQVNRLIQESLSSYKIQEILRRETAEIGEKIKASEAVCMNTAQADQLNQVRSNARVYATQQSSRQIAKSLDERRPVAKYITDRYASSNKEFCTDRDAINGLCKKVDWPGADINASYIFSSDPSDEGLSETYQDPKQIAAAEAFAERITGAKHYADVLPVFCETDQCRAYEEARRKAKSIESSVRNSYNYIIGRRMSAKDIQDKVDDKSKDKINFGLKGFNGK